MIKQRRRSYAVLFTLVILNLFALAAPQTFTGTVTDTMCGKKHMIAGKSDAECARECMKSKRNWTYGLIVGDKVYSLSADRKLYLTIALTSAPVPPEKAVGLLDQEPMLTATFGTGPEAAVPQPLNHPI